jgi:long-chain acyl-CoA synthetase
VTIAVPYAATLCEAFQATAARNPDGAALLTRDGGPGLTWEQYAQRVKALAAGLAGLGVRRGDTVALMLTNQPAFHLFDAAALHLGAIPFSMYNTLPAEDVAFLLSDAAARVVVTEQGFVERLAATSSASVEHLVVVDASARGALSPQDVAARATEEFDFDAAWRAVRPDDVATLIYTSGTTGPPKGVELSHRNVLASIAGYDEAIRFPPAGRVVSWLPMAHIAERICSHYLPMTHGYSATCCPDPRQIAECLAEVHPTWFFAVPRIWEKLKAAIEASIEADTDEQRRGAARSAIAAGLRAVRIEQSGQILPAPLREERGILDAKLFSAIRAQLGLDQAALVNVGGAPAPDEVLEFFHAIGIPVAEVWGMSETAGAGAINRPDAIKIGTVGRPLGICDIKLACDGELLVRGPTVMTGYRGQPTLTAETLDGDGWLRTGDIGRFDDDGYLTIVDRKKELIINAAGKNMSPAKIESCLKAASSLIGQAVAIGDRRPYNVALVTLDPDAATAFAQRHGLSAALESLASEPLVLGEISRGVEQANEHLARVEQIKRFKLLPVEWQPASEELTPTSKLKRRPIATKYARQIEELYDETRERM